MLLGGAALLACSAASWRELTYPPDFDYITEGEIRGSMAQLAVRIRALDAQMEQPSPDPAAVQELLAEMQQLVRELKPREHSSHPRIDRGAPELRRQIERALAGARMRPPNYFWAGQLSGACESCHVPRHE